MGSTGAYTLWFLLATVASTYASLATTMVTKPFADQARTVAAPDGYLAMCLITRDSVDLRDWLQHYLDLGVSKVYVFDHNSSTPVIKQVWDYVEEQTVVYHYIEDFSLFEGDTIVQFEAYRQCIKKYAHRHQFLAFFDDDEYLVLKRAAGTRSLADFLQSYEDHGGLAVNWQIIGSSEHVTRPPGKVTDNYIQCIPEDDFQNTHVKVIANTRYVVSTDGNPHTFAYLNGKTAVNEAFAVVPSAFSDPVSTEKVVLYHYTVKSYEDFQRKADWRIGAGGGTRKDQDFFDNVNEAANATCTLLQDRRRASVSVHVRSKHSSKGSG